MEAGWQAYLENRTAVSVNELLEFLRIPSVSALPEHAADVMAAATWVARRVSDAGMERVQVMPTGGHPIVYGEWLHAPGRPTVMVYGHFDTQPVDPLDLWAHPPFEPRIEGDRVYARGATDDKGNMLAPILALQALLATEGRLPVNVKCFFEGQEEIGSPNLPPFIADHRDLLACDLVLSADGGQWSESHPTLTVGLRGICALQIDVTGPAYDLHSGSFGGAVHNPIHALVALLASLRDEHGRIQVDGFYEGVVELSRAEKSALAAMPFDEVEYMSSLGVSGLFGEQGYSPLERVWVRPTLEINGIWGGFQGQGSKTVLPSEAHAKITCRLVPRQEPGAVVAAIQRHVARFQVPGASANARAIGNGTPAYEIPHDHRGFLAAKETLTALYGVEPYLTREGGSIPVCSLFLKHLGAHTVIYGFGLKDERTHSPNEFFRLSSFARAQVAYAMLLRRLGETAIWGPARPSP